MLGQDWEASIRAIKGCPNVYADLSGSGCSRGCIEFAVRELGAERCVFGTDGSIAPCVAAITCAEIGDDERELILSGNAMRLLGIHGGGDGH
jgi:predicted TIM-barrel fold metal-dependent hydrolase